MNIRKPPISAIQIKLPPITATFSAEKTVASQQNLCIVTGESKKNSDSELFTSDQTISSSKCESTVTDKDENDHNNESVKRLDHLTEKTKLNLTKIIQLKSITETLEITDVQESTKHVTKGNEMIIPKRMKSKVDSLNRNASLISKWRPQAKENTILPRKLLEEVTNLIRMVYRNNEKLTCNQYILQEIHSEHNDCKLVPSYLINNNSDTIVPDNNGASVKHETSSKSSTKTNENIHKTKTVPAITKSSVLMTSITKQTKIETKIQKPKTIPSSRKTNGKEKEENKTKDKSKTCLGSNIPKCIVTGTTEKNKGKTTVDPKKTSLPESESETNARAYQNGRKTSAQTKAKANQADRQVTSKVKKDAKIKEENKTVKKTKIASPVKKKQIISKSFEDSKAVTNRKEASSKQNESSSLIESNDNIIDKEDDFLFKISIDVLQETVSPEEAAVYDLSHLFTGKFDKDYEKWKKRERRSTKKTKHYHDDGKEKKKAPNYFVAIQITNPEITKGIGEVQKCMLKANENLKATLIPLPTLHLTLRVACLENDDHISRMVRALDKTVESLNKENDEMITLDVEEVGSFRNEVVFAKVKENDGLSKVIRISDILEECSKNFEVPPSDGKGFTPHITIAKLSKIPFKLKKKVKKIDASSYEEYSNRHFGKQLVTCLQLCSMHKRKDKAGYYHVSYVTSMLHMKQFSTFTADKYNIADVAHALVTTVIYKALLQINGTCESKCSS